MFSNIVVASDLSHRSERALRRGMQLAASHGATLTVAFVVDGDLPMGMASQVAKAAQQDLTDLCGSISDVSVDLKIVTGETVQELLSITEAAKADLLCLGVHRKRAFWDLFSGTTMERIVRAVPCPVLLVRDSVDHEYRSILCGIDLSAASAAALNISAALAPKAAITTFHAFHVPYRGMLALHDSASQIAPFLHEAEAELDTWWAANTLPETASKPVPEAESRDALLARMFDTAKPDILAIGAHGRPSLAPTILGGFTERLLREPPCDILVARG